MSQVSRYHPLLVVLHWALALLIVAALTLGAVVMVRIPNGNPMKIEALRSHMIGGVLILALMLARLAVRWRTEHPAPASAGDPRLDKLAWASHRLFYVLVLAMAGSGLWLALDAHLPSIVFGRDGPLPPDFWVFTPRPIHYLVSRLLMLLIALHVAAALYHAVFLKDGLLRRMGFGRRGVGVADPAGRAPISTQGRSGLEGYAPWISRAILVPPILLFSLIGWRYLSDPVAVAAASGISLGMPSGVTDMRAVGAIFLALAAILLVAVSATRLLRGGLAVLATVVGVVTAARVLGAVVDGATSETIFKLVPEVVLLALSLVGLAVEAMRRRPLLPAAAGRRGERDASQRQVPRHPAFFRLR